MRLSNSKRLALVFLGVSSLVLGVLAYQMLCARMSANGNATDMSGDEMTKTPPGRPHRGAAVASAPKEDERRHWTRRALDCLDFSAAAAPKVVAVRPISAAELEIPFLNDKLKEVELVAVELKVKHTEFGQRAMAEPLRNPRLDRLRCVFVRETGRVLEIRIEESGLEGRLPSEKTMAEYEKTLEVTGQRFVALPAVDTEVKIRDLLSEMAWVLVKNSAPTYLSKRIVIRYMVTQVDIDSAGSPGNPIYELFSQTRERRPRWIAECYSVPPASVTRAGDQPKREAKTYRNKAIFVFSKSGECLTYSFGGSRNTK